MKQFVMARVVIIILYPVIAIDVRMDGVVAITSS